MNLCPNCQKRTKQKHFNSKWCLSCADGFRKQPKPNLTPWQKKEALRLRGKVTKEEIAKRIGASRSSIMRLGRDLKLSFNALNQYKLQPELVEKVCEYYGRNGKRKTQERFPNVNVRSIVETYTHFAPRQLRWTDNQLKELARMAGIVSIQAQAKYFNRPRANSGSIVSAWMKKFGVGGGAINGLSWNIARHFLTKDCTPIQTKFWRQRVGVPKNTVGRKIVLWIEMEKHLKSDIPEWLKESIEVMACFQRWLHGTTHVKSKITQIIGRIER